MVCLKRELGSDPPLGRLMAGALRPLPASELTGGTQLGLPLHHSDQGGSGVWIEGGWGHLFPEDVLLKYSILWSFRF